MNIIRPEERIDLFDLAFRSVTHLEFLELGPFEHWHRNGFKYLPITRDDLPFVVIFHKDGIKVFKRIPGTDETECLVQRRLFSYKDAVYRLQSIQREEAFFWLQCTPLENEGIV